MDVFSQKMEKKAYKLDLEHSLIEMQREVKDTCSYSYAEKKTLVNDCTFI